MRVYEQPGSLRKEGKGPHAFRHARAVSLLRSGVPLKIIGDVLGHTSAGATAGYLKLATEDLRSIGLVDCVIDLAPGEFDVKDRHTST
ncbi:tyrosine-type recombinase/integrase [Caballeronia sp. PC1]|uniref:tyrosine-type recombinase/integrase n=1 Tax=unclassified Caballeronia TaxID=2646786 RepID=UPI0035C809D8